jgi:hypothetical protein
MVTREAPNYDDIEIVAINRPAADLEYMVLHPALQSSLPITHVSPRAVCVSAQTPTRQQDLSTCDAIRVYTYAGT